MRTVGRHAAWGALVGLVLVTLFALGTMDDQPDVPWPVRLILALAMGGLLYGAPSGAVGGGMVGVVRWRRNRVTPITSGPPRAAVTAGAEQAPYGLNPGAAPVGQAMSEETREAIRARAQQSRETRTAAAQPVPLAPIQRAPEREALPQVDLQDPDRLNRILAELDGLPGLEPVAEQVRSMARRVALDQKRRAQGLQTAEAGYHAIFAGPPGTGKTTVARIWGRALAAMGALPSGHVVETDRQGLVGQHVGSTAIRTGEKFDAARGGVLFVDEAYALTPAGPQTNDFGREAVEVILARMENERATTAVIAAGYAEDMERFLDSNPGLASRFGNTVTFGHYSGPALVAVAETLAQKADYRWDEGALTVLRPVLNRLSAAPPKGWANARSIRSLLGDAVTAQANRFSDQDAGDLDQAALTTLTEADVRAAVHSRYPGAL